jgi:hypothetical protein
MQENGLAQVHVNVANWINQGGSLVTVPTSSRAGSLPQGNAFHCGSEPARDEASYHNPHSDFEIAFTHPEMQNANPKVGVLFSSSAA